MASALFRIISSLLALGCPGESATHVVHSFADLKQALRIDGAHIDMQSDIVLEEGASASGGLLVEGSEAVILESTTGSMMTRSSNSPCRRFLYVSGRLSLRNMHFKGGCSGGNAPHCGGSAVWVGKTGSLLANSTVFEKGVAYCNNGGAVHVEGSFVANDGYFDGNQAAYWNGGAVHIAKTGTFSCHNCYFKNNNKAQGKGSYVNRAGTASLTLSCTSRASSEMDSKQCGGCAGSLNCDGLCHDGYISESHVCKPSDKLAGYVVGITGLIVLRLDGARAADFVENPSANSSLTSVIATFAEVADDQVSVWLRAATGRRLDGLLSTNKVEVHFNISFARAVPNDLQSATAARLLAMSSEAFRQSAEAALHTAGVSLGITSVVSMSVQSMSAQRITTTVTTTASAVLLAPSASASAPLSAQSKSSHHLFLHLILSTPWITFCSS
eukprot:TRINITY_DN10346_c0_g1_i1.p1 TRINITY_DN10346_c0_g1~~TRINITY_DN10346_c0_g1_i1.p1  ORF type:complete len:442 (-),score=54.15 TRINITY_DN10346_c0_g1_i1:24-1349(-)